MPSTGAPRPPAVDRLRLYGYYKQAREGDVQHVMARPTASSVPFPSSSSMSYYPDGSTDAGARETLSPEELQREQDKWDAWHSRRGMSATEAKKRYIEALIGMMHMYATTPDARELAAELEFVWAQMRDGVAREDGLGKRLGGRRRGNSEDDDEESQ